uniref:Reverse transcriptase zinc-binding domain-containing protein n=1 Tax=Lygus hesperus TaxID=30085 RepID=A0A0A9YTG2_LYGHE
MVEACALQLIESSYLIHSEENSKIDDVSLSVAPTHLSLNAYSCCGKSILYACLCYKLFLIFNTIKSSVPLLSTITESSFVPISLIVQITSHHYSSRGSCELCSTLSSCPTEEAKCEVAHHGSNRDQIEVQSSVATHLRNTASPIVRLQLTQFLTGHGYFRSFLVRIGKAIESRCVYCQTEDEEVHHTFFVCQRWERMRSSLMEEIGDLEPETVITKMTTKRENWDAVNNFVIAVLKAKEREREWEG